MLGAIAGDIIGSVFEHAGIKTKDFPLFAPGSTYTDDTVLTIAVAEAILTGDGWSVPWDPYGRCPSHMGMRLTHQIQGRKAVFMTRIQVERMAHL